MPWGGSMADSGSSRGLLTRELGELFWVAVGAVPGALLRWQLGLQLVDRNVLVNVCGAAFSADWPVHPLQPGVAPARCWLLWFVDHLSSWMLDTARLLGEGRWERRSGCWLSPLVLAWGPPGCHWLAQWRRPPDPIGVLTQPAEGSFDGAGELSCPVPRRSCSGRSRCRRDRRGISRSSRPHHRPARSC